ncbi:MAG: radical SAM protein [Dehalococcoidia bacterium]|nr:radical SAM protein [Dehalococcoidia bacterium]
MPTGFELGPIRPPSEAFSLLIRVTRNCPWNKCLFCHCYKGTTFSLRSMEEIVHDIDEAAAMRDYIVEASHQLGLGGDVRQAAATLLSQGYGDPCLHNVALFLYAGGVSAFLQDSNSLIMRTPDMVATLQHLYDRFPSLERVTTYSRSHTAAHKTLEELKEIREAGLVRIHIGLETGYDPLLDYIQKGTTAAQQISAGQKLVEAGFSLSEYVMPGLGGQAMAEGHTVETARVLNEINPDFIRFRSLHVTPTMPLWERVQDGSFLLQSEDDVVREIAGIIERLEVTSQLKSDHILNLLMDLEGQFPEAKPACLAIINEYLSLPDDERLNFQLGRRMGLYETLADLHDTDKFNRVAEGIQRIQERGDSVDEVIRRLKDRFI